MDLTSFRVPIGVCAGIAPFNFPAMIPLWMFPMGVITGNTYIMKPSERDPGACMALVELLQEAGCPPGNYFAMSTEFNKNISDCTDAATSSGILKAKQKLGVTFNSDKLGGIDFTKFSKLTMCSA